MISGSFETHLTVSGHQAPALARFAVEHGLKFVHIELDRGSSPSQPMLTWQGTGTLDEQKALAEQWSRRLRDAGFWPQRSKIEATPWSAGVPETDRQARDEPAGRYFEHHIKVLLPAARVADLLAITDLAGRHGARLSRNARRSGADGSQERFVNQRCHGAGRTTATAHLDRLVADLRSAGHEVVSVEQEYVVHDSHLGLDHGWLTEPEHATTSYQAKREERMRTAPAGARDYPPTYQPITAASGVGQRAAFDPALKQHLNAYTAGEPIFADPALGRRWRDARRAAMAHLLTVIAGTRWAGHLVLRGSVTMAAWVGTAAREPGDLDFVVTPPALTSGSAEARALLDEITAAVAAAPGAGLRPERTAESEIWTYERADGRRLVIPFEAAGLPDGTVQVDIVFGEHLPIPPEPITVLGAELLAATAGLSLAWKLMWLATDMYPQGKDLYDAVLLAEHTGVDLELVRDLMRPELPAEAGRFAAETVLTWSDVDWDNFADEYPGVRGTRDQWLRRLAVALDRSWGSAAT